MGKPDLWKWAARGVWPDEIARTEIAADIDDVYRRANAMIDGGAYRAAILLATPSNQGRTALADSCDLRKGEPWVVGLERWRANELAASDTA